MAVRGVVAQVVEPAACAPLMEQNPDAVDWGSTDRDGLPPVPMSMRWGDW